MNNPEQENQIKHNIQYNNTSRDAGKILREVKEQKWYLQKRRVYYKDEDEDEEEEEAQARSRSALCNLCFNSRAYLPSQKKISLKIYI